MNRQQRRKEARANAHEEKLQARISEENLLRKDAKARAISRIERNGITLPELAKEYERGYKYGASDSFKSMMAATCLALKELHGFSDDQLLDIMQTVDNKIIFSLTTSDLIDEVLEQTGLKIFWDEPFDRVQKV